MLNLNDLKWRRSSRCATSTCVEVAKGEGDYFVRDSKHPEHAVLRFTEPEWKDFLAGVEAGEFRE